MVEAAILSIDIKQEVNSWYLDSRATKHVTYDFDSDI